VSYSLLELTARVPGQAVSCQYHCCQYTGRKIIKSQISKISKFQRKSKLTNGFHSYTLGIMDWESWFCLNINESCEVRPRPYTFFDKSWTPHKYINWNCYWLILHVISYFCNTNNQIPKGLKSRSIYFFLLFTANYEYLCKVMNSRHMNVYGIQWKMAWYCRVVFARGCTFIPSQFKVFWGFSESISVFFYFFRGDFASWRGLFVFLKSAL